VTNIRIAAWILISIPEGGGTLREISSVADGINHAVPTPRELQEGLRWLTRSGLVVKQGRQVRLTASGAELLARVSTTSETIIDTWDRATTELERLVASPTATP
jgi:hypothetical protein